ncbi:hypothetical protein EB75_26880 [Mycobacterium sp. ST-F2]|uniref:hypothetical protein n=1 Tax=Mycobacterium sp. ST-F2 TaxID=1490484 RepID=UPI00093DEF4E|nr:hypothetical protein [Mycobacterium sp. ST-F2]OKH85320.1 hypothetical protein EB75_26880 [Mycobacterium sp. ST-F2]
MSGHVTCTCPTVPPGTEFVDIWETLDGHTSRVVSGGDTSFGPDLRCIAWADAIQNRNGTIHSAAIRVDISHETDPLTAEQARILAETLVRLADQVDAWDTWSDARAATE